MYLSQSQYSDIDIPLGLNSPGDTCKVHLSRFILASVLLHLLIVFCLITLNIDNQGGLLPGEKVVEINLVNMRMTSTPMLASMPMKSMVNKKPISPPAPVKKKEVKPRAIPEKKIESHSAVTKEITPPVKSEQAVSSGYSEVIKDYSSKKISDTDRGDFSQTSHEVNGSFEKISVNASYEYGMGDASSGNGALSQGEQYVDENFYYVKELITSNLVYPAVARRMKWQGTVEVSFRVLKTGSVENIRVLTSSGYSLLDKNVIATIESVQPFPPPPVAAEFTMPIKYTLKP
ncbi:MAG: TonB family protein [Deltaproteobacteria bacterium]|nr:TonB family protein [Deltaproteobacteria bacterium]